MLKMKVASQQHFEETYLENKELFDDMSHEELVAETVNQLSSQGVNLQNILCSPQDFDLDDDNVFRYKVLSASDEYMRNMTSENAANLIKLLRKDLATRVFAAQHGCYRNLVDSLSSGTTVVLDVLVAILEKQPDLVQPNDMETILSSFTKAIESVDESNLKLFLALIVNICTLHEENRQNMVKRDAPDLVLKAMAVCPKLFILECSALRVFLLDDDVRVPFGKAHEHAQHIVGQLEGIKVVIDCYKLTKQDVNSSIALFATLGKFCVRNEYCQQVVDEGAFDIMKESMQIEEMKGNEKFVLSLLSFLKTAGGNDDVKDKIAEAGFLKEIVLMLDEFMHSESVCHGALVTLSVVVLRKPEYSKQVFENKFAPSVVMLLDRYNSSVKVMQAAFLAIRTLVTRFDEGKQLLIANGVEEYLQNAASEIEELRESANDTLRVIESSKGTLNEPWTGELGDRIAQD